ncbi:TIR domain-containing protein [Chryseobacterium sp. Leaf394]|uniref:TIR domain-containing protein n=1 Tax=Chryseobacterium sp. Leaf394 TaxID=1736361 RepID=UPI0006F23676|nr:TIR domain-containing protein [Chryseobacterium sp. Leaf394]KQS92086.1 hypothetical protein ASG21_06425 [Chryseobacterium sp. Leaf394]
MKSSSYVFISFKTQERELALILKEGLNSSGYKVWWQEEIQCGQEWHGEIDKAIEQAGAIVVLWSTRSMKSPWVRHEASQATIRDVYTPVRIEIMEVDSPYNRIQATDIINWDGNLTHPGFQNLLVRLNELMPPPVPFWRQTKRFLWKQRAVLVISVIAFYALFLLLRQSTVLKQQIKKQDETFKNVQQQRQVLQSQETNLQSQGTTLQAQLEKQEQLITNGRKQSEVLNEQLAEQQEIAATVRKQNETLKAQIQKQEDIFFNVQRSLQPLQNFSISAYVDIDASVPGVKEYLSNLRDTLLDRNTQKLKPLPSGVYVSIGREDSPHQLSISERSGLWPSEQDNSGLYYVVKYVEFSLEFRKSKNKKVPLRAQGSADLVMQVGSFDPDGSEGSNSSPAELKWDLQSNNLSVSFNDISSTKYWESNGKIVSVPDIESSIMTTQFLSIMVPNLFDENASTSLRKSRAGLSISSLFIEYSGRRLHFRGKDMKNVRDDQGLRMYETLVLKGVGK